MDAYQFTFSGKLNLLFSLNFLAMKVKVVSGISCVGDFYAGITFGILVSCCEV